MWTTKRILLLVSGFVLFVVFYGVYAFFLGWVDGFPVLPVALHPPEHSDTPIDFVPEEPISDKKLRMAFGKKCPEVKHTIKVDIKSRMMTFACNEFNILEDGRVKFTPFSIAIFSKDRKDGLLQEINTLRSDEAILTFDRPISNKVSTEFSSRKIVGAELRGDITVVNNRRSLEKDDDLMVRIAQRPLFYSESRNLIWSDGVVHLIDTQSRPHPTRVSSQGMELHLSKKEDDLTHPEQSTARISGLDKVVLLRNVDMHIHIDTESKFLSGGPAIDSGNQESVKNAKKKSHVHVSTYGKFLYDVNKDLAIFDSPASSTTRPPFPSESVQVAVIHDEGLKTQIQDDLDCHRLILQFRKKENDDGPVVREDRSSDREIESAIALADPDKKVTLVINSENLAAEGTKLTYFSPTPNKGAETLLEGSPMRAMKDAHQIIAKELRLIAPNKEGKGRFAFARGPGQIDLVDQNHIAKAHRYHAIFTESMKVTKSMEAGKECDLLTFKGGAQFRDDGRTSELHADTLQVWLEPAERKASREAVKQKMVKNSNAPRQQPLKLVGTNNVRVFSRELNVKKCEHLVLHFRDGHPGSLPESMPSVADGKKETEAHVVNSPKVTPSSPDGQIVPRPFNPRDPGAAQVVSVKTKSIVPSFTGQEQSSSKQKPIDVVAKKVKVFLLRTGKRNELQEVITEGNVVIHQDGKKPDDKGVDIRGEIVNLIHHIEGDKLIVHGDKRKPAQLQMGEMILVGPTVEIDQKVNIAVVNGLGAMDVPSKTNLNGGETNDPNARLKIYWNKEMFFDGKVANFSGGVQAYQNSPTKPGEKKEMSALRCSVLQVRLDKSVSFKEGQRNGDGAKVEMLICSKKVDVFNRKDGPKTEDHPNGKFLEFNRLYCLELQVDNKQGPIKGKGPGRVDLLHYGSDTFLNNQPNEKKQELHLTRIEFQGWMFWEKKEDGSHRMTFNENVEVFHLPTNNPNIKLDRYKLPVDTMYMKCDRLIVNSIPLADGKKQQYLDASGGVIFRTKDFDISASVARYDQKQEQLVFEGAAGNPAIFSRSDGGPGNPRQDLTARKIIYNRRTGRINLDGVKSLVINGN